MPGVGFEPTSHHLRPDLKSGALTTRPTWLVTKCLAWLFISNNPHSTGRIENHAKPRGLQFVDVERAGEAEVAHQRGQHDFDLEHCELLTDAIPRTGAERNERVPMPLESILRKKALRSERFWIFKNVRIVVHSVNEHWNGSSGWNDIFT